MNPIKRIRQKLGLTQAELARALGQSQGNISHYETGRQTVPGEVAKKLIDLGKQQRRRITLGDIYPSKPQDSRNPE
ncbi:putative zinc finger/helix-turn-helix protein%2C YgiT family [Bordetella ansorpii]|uniref:Putative zinc finger/helix-turn-helix protein, YgiT family n=1 Tax=Bordetella ansorpii TaxID=288768 RepID=A0A157QP64_9BORD|nr:helix-turn-helix transcriptional regulator [Bordetella ansorpii]SAI47561.1 putative zinc finger/helix-turn-helix protein%2C YgiT family [Bordetella ansorpii]